MNNLKQLIEKQDKEFEEKFIDEDDKKFIVLMDSGFPQRTAQVEDVKLFLSTSRNEIIEAVRDEIRKEAERFKGQFTTDGMENEYDAFLQDLKAINL